MRGAIVWSHDRAGKPFLFDEARGHSQNSAGQGDQLDEQSPTLRASALAAAGDPGRGLTPTADSRPRSSSPPAARHHAAQDADGEGGARRPARGDRLGRQRQADWCSSPASATTPTSTTTSRTSSPTISTSTASPAAASCLSQPRNGYDVPTRAADDIAVLDAMGIRKAVFVGHSLAGSELSRLGAAYAEAGREARLPRRRRPRGALRASRARAARRQPLFTEAT